MPEGERDCARGGGQEAGAKVEQLITLCLEGDIGKKDTLVRSILINDPTRNARRFCTMNIFSAPGWAE